MANPAQGRELLDWLDHQQPAMIELLGKLVNIDSGSYDREGVDRVGDVLRDHFLSRGMRPQVNMRPEAAYCLKVEISASAREREPGHILLLGHRDTVFPQGEVLARPFH